MISLENATNHICNTHLHIIVIHIEYKSYDSLSKYNIVVLITTSVFFFCIVKIDQQSSRMSSIN